MSAEQLVPDARRAARDRFQDLVNKDRFLSAHALLDPLGTFSRHGLVGPEDTDLSLRLARGSLLDLVYVREAVEMRGPADAVKERQVGAAEDEGVVVDVIICVGGVCVEVVVTV